jgi:3-oxoacyl-[acyl-carrier-protein] synthase-3
MAYSVLKSVAYRGLASAVPKNVVSNLDVAPEKKSERERLVRNIGINTRRLCPANMCFSDLAEVAAKKLMAELNWKSEEIDALIVVTQTPDYIIPATAIVVQDRMGLPKKTLAFDINLGCSGYPFGMFAVGSMLSSGHLKKALVLIGDKCGSFDDPLFSDCGTATALEYDPAAPDMYFDLNSDGSGYQAIILKVGGSRCPAVPEHFIPRQREDGSIKREVDLYLDGPAVLSFSTTTIPSHVSGMLDHSKLPKDSIDYFLFHQANKMINQTIMKKLGLSEDRVPSTLWDFGNTSSASIPITITAKLNERLNSVPSRLLMCGFGIGLSWGTAVIDIKDAKFPALIEV